MRHVRFRCASPSLSDRRCLSRSLPEHVRGVARDKVAERRGEVVRRSDLCAKLFKGDVLPIARQDSW